jgi:hypothetical protein
MSISLSAATLVVHASSDSPNGLCCVEPEATLLTVVQYCQEDRIMQTPLRVNTMVLPGHRIEVNTPELPEGACIELIINDPSAEAARRYPSALEVEYNALVDKELHGALTAEEAVRLEDICKVIAEIDRLTLSNDIRIQRLDQIKAELADLRAEIEALPDA